MSILVGVGIYFLTSLLFTVAWALFKYRTDCAQCAQPLSEGSDKRYCVGCLVERELNK